MNFDPRITPARPDLAAKRLQGQVQASRFVEGTTYEVIDATAPLRHAPASDAPLDTEALMGERVTVYEIHEGWAWGQLESDRYVGYLPANSLAKPGPTATHKVAVPRTLIFPGPSIKLPPLAAPPLGAKLAIVKQDGTLAVTAAGFYVPARHLAPLDAKEPDFVAVAEKFLSVPYLWGGKTSFGLDCSGLVQASLTACGLSCPRDSDMQEGALGSSITPNADYSDLRRGDLIFWKGHVAMVRDAATIIHANAFHMAVTIEPTREALVRIKAGGSEVSSVKRLAGLSA